MQRDSNDWFMQYKNATRWTEWWIVCRLSAGRKIVALSSVGAHCLQDLSIFLKDICWLHQYSSTLQLELYWHCRIQATKNNIPKHNRTELNFIAHDFFNRSEQQNNIPKHNASDRQRTSCSLHVHAQFMRPQVVQKSRKNEARTQPNILLSLYETTQANRMLPYHLVKTWTTM